MSDKEQILARPAEQPADAPTRQSPRNDGIRPTPMDLPPEPDLPLFVYGALKPGMPAHERLRDYVERCDEDSVNGELYVRDGLPQIRLNSFGTTDGFVLHWKAGREIDGYEKVCAFEPRSQYEWKTTDLNSGSRANVLVSRREGRANPEPLHVRSWNLRDDAPFGPGLDAVEKVLHEAETKPLDSGAGPDFEKFFRLQMAYLLLWSILERLSALCIGPSEDPNTRIKRLHELPGIREIVANRVNRTAYVFDTRNPKTKIQLDRSDPKKAFEYYYQLRCNLSHRGKGSFHDLAKVHDSLCELLAITRDYLASLPSTDEVG